MDRELELPAAAAGLRTPHKTFHTAQQKPADHQEAPKRKLGGGRKSPNGAEKHPETPWMHPRSTPKKQ